MRNVICGPVLDSLPGPVLVASPRLCDWQSSCRKCPTKSLSLGQIFAFDSTVRLRKGAERLSCPVVICARRTAHTRTRGLRVSARPRNSVGGPHESPLTCSSGCRPLSEEYICSVRNGCPSNRRRPARRMGKSGVAMICAAPASWLEDDSRSGSHSAPHLRANVQPPLRCADTIIEGSRQWMRGL